MAQAIEEPSPEGVRMRHIDLFPQSSRDVRSPGRPQHRSQHRRRHRSRHGCRRALALAIASLVLLPVPSYAQGSPWENAVNVLMVSFTGPIARGLSLVSIVIGGVTFAFGEGGSKRLLAGIVFGVGMAIGAVNFMAWLFP
jgi:type IV secretory pathway VirB2 component (pilin)